MLAPPYWTYLLACFSYIQKPQNMRGPKQNEKQKPKNTSGPKKNEKQMPKSMRGPKKNEKQKPKNMSGPKQNEKQMPKSMRGPKKTQIIPKEGVRMCVTVPKKQKNKISNKRLLTHTETHDCHSRCLCD